MALQQGNLPARRTFWPTTFEKSAIVLGRQFPKLVVVSSRGSGRSVSSKRLADEVAVAARKMAFAIEEHFAAGVIGRAGLGAGDPPCLAKLEGDVRGGGLVAGVQRDVVGDQELAGADHRRAGAGIEPGRAAVGLPPRVLELLGQPLVLALRGSSPGSCRSGVRAAAS